jgi:beta-xylosidase
MRASMKLPSLSVALMVTVAASAPEPAFVPVFQENFPDAFVLPHNGQFIAYSTNDGPNVPVATSTDMVHWAFAQDAATGKKRDALPRLGAWAKEGFTWAPEVIELRGRYLLYYTASDRRKNAQCIGVATASDPMGPFIDDRAEPIVCQTELGGSIDADSFRDADGKLYLYFKNDGNRVGKNTAIWGQQLAPDGLSVLGQPVELIHNDKGWEQRLVEAPTMIRSPIGYELFFSAAYFGWNDNQRQSPYAMGYASCSAPLGPCLKSSENPILHSFHDRESGCLSGPGHQSVFMVAGHAFMSFHAWAATRGCTKDRDSRYLYIAPIFWRDGKPQLSPSLRPSDARP